MTTLLEKARTTLAPVKSKIKFVLTPETLELTLAWVNGEITDKQLCFVLYNNYKTGNHLYPMARLLREAVQQDKIKITLNK